MLSEIAITPSAFNWGLQEESMDWVGELERVLFPRVGDVPLVLCDLRNGEWFKSVARSIAMISNSSQRGRAQSLLSKLRDNLMSIPRNSALPDSPCDESMWIAEAIAANSILPIGMAFTTSPDARIRTLHPSRIGSDEIDHQLESSRYVPRELNSQVVQLRNLLWHSHWAIVRFPQIRGGDDDEIQTVKQVAELLGRSVCSSPSSTVRQLEVQLNPEALGAYSFQNVEKHFRDWRIGGVAISLTVSRAKYVNRELIAGDLDSSDAKKIKRARWYLTMQHVAIKRSDSSVENNIWNYFGRRKAHERWQKILSTETAPTPVAVIEG